MFSEVKRVSFSWKPLMVTSGRWWVVSGAVRAVATLPAASNKHSRYGDERVNICRIKIEQRTKNSPNVENKRSLAKHLVQYLI